MAFQKTGWRAGDDGAIDLVRSQQSFDGVSAFQNVSMELSGTGEPVRVDVGKITSSVLSVLGVSPLFGRAFTSARAEITVR